MFVNIKYINLFVTEWSNTHELVFTVLFSPKFILKLA